MLGFSQHKISLEVNFNTEINVLTKTDSQIHKKEGIGHGYTLGIQTLYFLNERIFLRSGINYQESKHQYKIEGLRWSSGLITSSQNCIQFTSLGIPMDFGYKIRSKNQKINYLIGIGGLINISLDTKTDSKIYNETDEEPVSSSTDNTITKRDKLIYSIRIFGGFEIDIGDNTILGIEPNFKFVLNNYTLNFVKTETSTIESGITLRLRMK